MLHDQTLSNPFKKYEFHEAIERKREIFDFVLLKQPNSNTFSFNVSTV